MNNFFFKTVYLIYLYSLYETFLGISLQQKRKTKLSMKYFCFSLRLENIYNFHQSCTVLC